MALGVRVLEFCATFVVTYHALFINAPQELGLTRRNLFVFSFIDPLETYDSVDRNLLWDVLACLRRQDKIIEISGTFHDSIGAYQRLNDGMSSTSSM